MRIPSKSKCEHPVNSNYTLPLRRTQDSARGSRSRSVDDDCTINCRHLLLRPPYRLLLMRRRDVRGRVREAIITVIRRLEREGWMIGSYSLGGQINA